MQLNITPPNTEAFSVKQQATIERLSNAAESDVKEIAVTQLELLSQYYELSLSQAGRSFRVALIASAIGLLFFLGVIAYMLIVGASAEISTVGVVGGALSSFIAAVNFFLYGKTLTQLNIFQGKLESTQRFLLANSLSENLENSLKQRTRARLIAKLAGVDNIDYLRDYQGDLDGDHADNHRSRDNHFDPTLDSSGTPLPSEEVHTDEVAARPQ